MKIKTRLLSFLLALCMIVSVAPLTALTAFASGNGEEKEDAMVNIEASGELAASKQGDTQTLVSDGYIGIPVEVTVYYDYVQFGAAKPGYNGTAVILYVINSGAERTGTASDTDIIKSMLDRGYAVAVCDYMNNAKAVSPDLEYSAQKVRTKLRDGAFFRDKTVFPSGAYYENHVVTAGHNVSLNHVFYEIDKHGTDGVLERIVHVWNEDFRGCKRDVIIKWTDENGNRKTTQNGFDGSAPVWYSDAAGKTVDNANGQYIKVQYTKAMKITDCVKKDGSPIDYNLYMHVIYPDTPGKDVPVMVLSGSSEHLASGTAAEDRPYLVGYSMQGYAIATFDFEYVPMSRNDHYGYFSGDATGGLTGTNGTFALGSYNRSNFQTAAIRYLRYLSINDHDTFSFNNGKFGIYGNSKGGFQTFLGAAALRESTTLADLGAGATKADLEAYVDGKVAHFYNDAYITALDPNTNKTVKFDGNSRYQNGKTADAVAGNHFVDGGKLQPWLTYTDAEGILREIPSGVQWVYSSCGGTASHEWKDHSPAFTAANYYDSFGSGYSTHNYLENCFRIYDVPSLFFEAPLEHNIVSGNDVNHGVDTYLAMFKASHYYLKDTPVSVVYTVPANSSAGVKTTDDITVRFYGPVSAEDIATVTVKDSNGNVAQGTWESGYGKTQWTFHPKALNGGVKYTVTVPASLKGDNGKAMGQDYAFSFFTNAEGSEVKSNVATVTDTVGSYVSFTVPTLKNGDDQIKLRFKVANDAANIANVYAAASATDTAGALLGSVNLKGAGYYEIDVTDHVMGKTAGSTVYFLIKARNTVGDVNGYKHDFANKDGITTYRTSTELVTSVNGQSVTALKMINTNYGGWYPHVMTVAKAINNGTVTKADYGRRFTVTFRVYDTASRSMQVWFNDCTNGSKTTGDYDYTRAVVQTKANEWIEISVPYVVYEMDYGFDTFQRQIRLIAYSTGSTEMPYYIDSLTVTEHVTAIEMTEASLVTASVDDRDYKAPSSENASWEVSGQQVATWWEAILKTGTSEDKNASNVNIKLLSDYTFDKNAHSTDADIIAYRKALVIDLNGYTVTLKDTPLLHVAADNELFLDCVVKNGTVVIDGAPVVKNGRSKTAGANKVSSFTFENVTFTVADSCNLLEVITTSTSPANATPTHNFTFDSCTFNIDRTDLPKAPTVLFPKGTANITNTYTFKGGSINVNSLIKLSLSDDVASFMFAANGKGEFTDLKVNEWNVVPNDMFFKVGNGYKIFVLDKTENFVSTYKLSDPKYSTPYGVIPDEYDPENYPFALFIDGVFIGAYGIFYNTSDSAKDNVFAALWQNGCMRGESDKNAYVVLRRDYDLSENSQNNGFNNMGQLGGNITFDLCDHKLTLSASSALIPMVAKYGYDSLNLKTDHVYPLSMSFKNGSIDARNGILIIYSSMLCDTDAKKAKYDEAKILDFTFDNIDFSIGNKDFIRTGDTANLEHGAEMTVDFKNCDFDLTANTSAITLFDGSDTSSMNVVTVNLDGGNFTATTLANVKFSALDTNDSLNFVQSGGKYTTTMTVPTSYTLPAVSGTGVGGMSVSFGGTGTVSGSNTVYGLVETGVSTKYGIIPSEFSDAQSYPFAIFKDGKFWKASANFTLRGDSGNNSVIALLQLDTREKGDSVYQVLLRRDFNATTAGDSKYDNVCQIGDNVIFDFGDHTLDMGSVTMFFLTAKYGWAYNPKLDKKDNYIYPSNFTVIGGKIISTGEALILFESMNVSEANYPKYNEKKMIGITFKGTEIVLGDQPLVKLGGGVTPIKGAELDLILEDCKIDYSANTAALNVFNGKDTKNMNDLCVTVKGGDIIAADISRLTLISGGTGDKVVFAKNGSGKYTALTVPTGTSLTTFGAVNEEGIGMAFGGSGTVSGSNTVYQLVENALVTKYGIIPSEYSDVQTYPFAIFMNGEFVSAQQVWSQNDNPSATKAVFDLVRGALGNGRTVTVLMRRDYTMGAGDMNYTNLGQWSGKVIIDLGEHTFDCNGKRFLQLKATTAYDPVSKGTIVVDPDITVIGGNIISNGANAIIAYTEVADKNKDYYTRASVFNVTFNGTRFIVPETNGKSILATWNDVKNADGKGAIFNITLNDCVIDVKSAPASNLSIFNMGDSTTYNVVNLTVNGGNAELATTGNITLFNVDVKDTLVLNEGENGYLTITAAAGAAPTAKFPTSGHGELAFGAVSKTDGITLYKLGVATEYGHIPYEYADVEKYPFAVFMDGYFVGAHSVWSQNDVASALWEARLLLVGNLGNGREVQILMRRDYAMNDGDMNYGNLAHLGGTLVIDLGEFTFDCNGKNFLRTRAQTVGDRSGTYIVDSNIIVKGGNIVTNGANAVLCYTEVHNQRHEYYTRAKIFTVTFEGTLFTIPATNGKSVVSTWNDANNEKGGIFNIIFNNCVIDDKATHTAAFNVFAGTDTSKINNVNITVNGGNIKLASSENVKLFYGDNADSIVFGKYEGSYTKLNIASGNAPAESFDTVSEGKATFKATENVGEYILTPCDHSALGDWKSDGENHYRECLGCGAKQNVGAHEGGKATCCNGKICTVCSLEYGSADSTAHSPASTWSALNGQHWKECLNGCTAKLELGSCNGEATCIAKAKCSVCETVYGELDPSNHDVTGVTEWKSEGGKHYQNCNCGVKINEGDHSSDEWLEKDGKHYKICEICNTEFASGDHSSDEWISDGNKHHKVCVTCNKNFDETACSGGEADCVNKAECSVCGNVYGSVDATEHVGSTDGKWYQENDKHYKLCQCGEKLDEAACSGGEADCVNKAECSVCGNKYGSVDATEHLGSADGKWYQENGKHYKLCQCGEKLDEAACSGGEATCGSPATCDVCGNAYGNVEADGHVPSDEWYSDGTNHWKVCTVDGCDAKVSESECYGSDATCEELGVCYVCGNDYGELADHVYSSECDGKCDYCEDERTAVGTHKYQDGCDTTCNECREVREVSHVYANDCDDTCDNCLAKRTVGAHVGGTATCEKGAVCTACGREYGDKAEHKYLDGYNYNSVSHWKECTCGSKKDEVTHTFTKGENGLVTCTCGYTVQAIPTTAKSGLNATQTVAISLGCAVGLGGVAAILAFLLGKKKLI